jgi:hypothetical protein
MQVQGVTVTKIIEPKLLGVFETHNVYLCHGKYGEYLRHNSLNYSIPEWAKMENLKEPFGIAQASNIIDWKIKNKVPRGEAVCKELDVSGETVCTICRVIEPKVLGEINGQWVTLMSRDNGHCRYLRYNGENYFINDKNKNLDTFTLEDAVRMFGWDRHKIVIKKFADVSENEWLSTTDCIGIHEIIST